MAHGFKNDIFLALVYHLTAKDSDLKIITLAYFQVLLLLCLAYSRLEEIL